MNILACVQYYNGYGLYYIVFEGFSGDFVIAQKIGMIESEYDNILISEYNAQIEETGTYFKSKKDAEKALEWITARYLAIKLSGGTK